MYWHQYKTWNHPHHHLRILATKHHICRRTMNLPAVSCHIWGKTLWIDHPCPSQCTPFTQHCDTQEVQIYALPSGSDITPPGILSKGRVLVIVATPDLPQGGSGDQKPPKRRPWRGTPLDVQRRRISDEEADVRGETRRVRAPAGRGRHELHPGRACFASMFVRQVRQCFSVVWADGFPRCRHRFPVM